jgi:hypothetical protein
MRKRLGISDKDFPLFVNENNHKHRIIRNEILDKILQLGKKYSVIGGRFVLIRHDENGINAIWSDFIKKIFFPGKTKFDSASCTRKSQILPFCKRFVISLHQSSVDLSDEPTKLLEFVKPIDQLFSSSSFQFENTFVYKPDIFMLLDNPEWTRLVSNGMSTCLYSCSFKKGFYLDKIYDKLGRFDQSLPPCGELQGKKMKDPLKFWKEMANCFDSF